MRLHRLRLQAFGPFAGTEEVDFDGLATGGLHLIHGPTGAGKTSVLDAICFALFAGVPGGRMQGRETLRSDHAEPSVRPEVELEFGVGGRRLRVRRSPEHEVAKKRGTGTRLQRGSVTLEERHAGGWETVSTRNDEVAQTIGDLLGMGLPQFAQVMLLPQGEFTAFLHAKPDDRGRLLERLFDISDFAALEQWLAGHRRSLETQRAQADAQRATLIARARDVLSGVVQETDGAIPADISAAHGEVAVREEVADDATDALGRLEDGADGALLAHLVEALSDRLTAALATADTAAGQVERLRGRLAAEQSLAALQRQAQAARRTLDEVADQAPRLIDAETRLEASARAERCRPAIAAAARRDQAHAQARRAAASCRTDLARRSAWPVPEPHHDDGLTETALDSLVERAAAGTAALAGRQEVFRQLRTLEGAVRGATDELRTAQRESEHRQHAIDAAATQLSQLHARHAEVLPDALAHPGWQQLLDEVDEATDSLAGAVHDVDALIAAEQEHRRTQRVWTAAEQEVLRLRHARLSGIAAELADDLVTGEPCPVCGSADHPKAARPAPDRVDADQVAAAEEVAAGASDRAAAAAARWSALMGRAQATCRTALDALTTATTAPVRDAPDSASEDDTTSVDGALTTRRALAATVDTHQLRATELTAALEAGSPSVDPKLATVLRSLAQLVTDARDRVTAEVDRSGSAADQLAILDEQVRSFEAERSGAHEALAARLGAVRLAQSRLESLRTQVKSGTSRLTEMTQAHDAACGCTADSDPAAEHAACVADLDRLRVAAAQQRTTGSEAGTAHAELDAMLQEAGFPDARSASQASLSDEDCEGLRSLVDTARTAAAKATGVLEQPDVAQAAQAPAAVVDEIAADLTSAEHEARHTRDAVSEVRRAHGKLQQITAELADHDEQVGPLRDELAVATSLASAVAGAGDNTMRMRLTAYVLAARLESVTALANERLQLMTDGRYQLEHTDQRAARGSKSGLGLRVRDAWTGTTRDTATLSGGESFIASLALALGLGDAVLESAGGRRLETLLVDEGFGSLDEDSLEQVLDVLDSLRAGGRSVGIVSHVAELRTRIPAQIRVHKTAHGSTLQVVTDSVA